MIDIDYEKFEKLFDEKIAPYLMQFEQERKKVCLKIFGGIIISFVSIFALWLLINAGIEVNNFIGYAIYIILFAAIWIIIASICTYKNNLKKAFYKNLFNFFDLNHSTSYGNNKIIEHVCMQSGIFYKYDNISVDDKLTGKYKDLPITIFDTKISYKYSYFGKRGFKGAEQTFFNGIFLATKINKDFKNSILIKTEKNMIIDFISTGLNIARFFVPFKPYILEKGMNIDKSKVKNNIKLEDVEFEKYFEVYGDDQVEARYMLTTAFIDRLLKYQKKYPHNLVEVVLDNNIIGDFNIYFFVNSGIDYFEIPIYRSLLNRDLFYNILKQLTELLEIIDALKLEQNIGL